MADTQQLLQLIDYVGVDYASAVENGDITNEAEYGEMLDFSAGISQHVVDLSDHKIKPEIVEQSNTLLTLIQQKASAHSIKTLTSQMHQSIISSYQITVVPRKQPDLQKGQLLYVQHCASCHGSEGLGDGDASIGMDPPPINFKDIERYKQRTLYGLYSTITQGVNDTAMQGYNQQFTAQERWSLAFYISGLATDPQEVNVSGSPLLDIKQLTTTTPENAQLQFGENGPKIMAYLRHHPEKFYKNQSSLVFARHRLDDALTAYSGPS